MKLTKELLYSVRLMKGYISELEKLREKDGIEGNTRLILDTIKAIDLIFDKLKDEEKEQPCG